MSERTLLVTGATGEIGGSLLEPLRTLGRLRVLSRRPRQSLDGLVEPILGDLQDPDSVSRACKDVDTVIHMAAVTHARRAADYYSINVGGTANLASAGARAGVRRFVHLSTRAVGSSGGAYSHSKQLAEDKVREAGIAWVILRPAEVYGGGGDPILSLAASLEARRWVPILGDGSYRLSPVHVDDVVAAIVAAVDGPDVEGREYVLAGPEEMSYLDLVDRIETLLGLSARRKIHVPVALAKLCIQAANLLEVGGYVPDQIPRLLLEKSSDSSAAIRDLAFSARTLEEGLRAVV